MILVPLVGARSSRSFPQARADLLQADRADVRSAQRCAEPLHAHRVRHGTTPGFQFVIDAPWIESLGISWHLGVDGISLFLLVLTGLLFPIAIVGHQARPRPQAVLLVAAGADGGLDGRVRGARSRAVLPVLRDRARADVLPHRSVGPRRSRLRGHEVLPLHHVRLGAHARRHPRHRVPAPAASAGALTFDVVQIATDQSISIRRRSLDLRRRSPSPSR